MRITVLMFLMMIGMITSVSADVKAVTAADTMVFRYAASSSGVVGTIAEGEEITLISPTKTHYEVDHGGYVGWIKRDAVKVTQVDGLISSVGVTMKSAPDDNASKTGKNLRMGSKVDITAILNGFCEVKTGDEIGYVDKKFILSDKLHLAPKKSIVSVPVNIETPLKPLTSYEGSGKEVAFLAMDYLGGRYVWGGNNLETGVDCSGFVRQVYKKCGVTLKGASQDLIKYGEPTDKADLTYGDLLFFVGNGPGIGHVGIYVSNDYFIHAASSKSGIIMSKLSARKDFVTAKRVI